MNLLICLPERADAEKEDDVLAVVDPLRPTWSRDFIAYNGPAGVNQVTLSTGLSMFGKAYTEYPRWIFAVVEVVRNFGRTNEVRKRYPIRVRFGNQAIHDVCKITVTD